jgi:hypothetical protein
MIRMQRATGLIRRRDKGGAEWRCAVQGWDENWWCKRGRSVRLDASRLKCAETTHRRRLIQRKEHRGSRPH